MNVMLSPFTKKNVRVLNFKPAEKFLLVKGPVYLMISLFGRQILFKSFQNKPWFEGLCRSSTDLLKTL